MTFSEEIKREICHFEFDEIASKLIILVFLINNSEFVIKEGRKFYVIKTQYNFIVRLLKQLIHNYCQELSYVVKTSESKVSSLQTKYIIEFDDVEQVDNKFNNLKLPSLKKNVDKKYFLIAAFLASGSISFSSNNANYHFEIRSNNQDYLSLVQKILSALKINAKIIHYRNSYKIYFKKSEQISDILKFFGVVNKLYEFEELRIQRGFTNSLQRINNLDISNIQKTIVASNKQILWIQTIKNGYALNLLSDKDQIFCKIRMQYPEESLASISEILAREYNIIIHRASLNHIVRRIEKLYLRIKDTGK